MQALSEWFYRPQACPTHPRLFCYPYAGGGVAAYRTWAPLLADTVELILARPPGRESRVRQAPLTEVGLIVDAVLADLERVIDREPARPFALYGHSLGGLVMFELARRLGKRGPPPAAVFVSGSRAPTAPAPDPIAELDDAAFVAELRELEGTPPGVLENGELMALLLPVLRADFGAAERYTRVPGPPLSVPLFVYGGRDDENPDHLQGWRQETTGPFSLKYFDGAHFFINTARDRFLGALRSDLHEVIPA